MHVGVYGGETCMCVECVCVPVGRRESVCVWGNVCVQSGEMWGGVWRECVCVNGREMMYVCRMCVRAGVCIRERKCVCVCVCAHVCGWWRNVCVWRLCVAVFEGETLVCLCVCRMYVDVCLQQENVWVCVERMCVFVWWGNNVCL